MRWHVKEQVGATVSGWFHFTVPAGNNNAGISWANAVKLSGVGGATTMPTGSGSGTDGGISTAEKTSVEAGSVYEETFRYDIQVGQTPAQIAAALDAMQAARSAELLGTTAPDSLQNRLLFFGAKASS